jgi:hypothetical protein
VQLSSFSFVYSDNFPELWRSELWNTKIKFYIGIEKYRTFTAAERMKQRIFEKGNIRKEGIHEKEVEQAIFNL